MYDVSPDTSYFSIFFRIRTENFDFIKVFIHQRMLK